MERSQPQLLASKKSPLKADSDLLILSHLLESAQKAGLKTDLESIANLFIALKSKPMVILLGPAHAEKIAAIQAIARGLVNDDPLRFQTMVGHPWWANRSDNVVQFIEAQTRWNTSKIMDLITEAGQPENAHRLYIACMTRISPAEVNEFFTGMAFQIKRGQVMRVGTVHYTEPIGFPSNVLLVGTMDENRFKWMDDEILSNVSLVHWNPGKPKKETFQNPHIINFNYESAFLNSCLRNSQAAFRKLGSLLYRQQEPFLPLIQVGDILREHHINLSNSYYYETMTYLANSWSQLGSGLFQQAIITNLNIALDFTITQSFLLPLGEKLADSARLCKKLAAVLSDRFPRSASFVANIA